MANQPERLDAEIMGKKNPVKSFAIFSASNQMWHIFLINFNYVIVLHNYIFYIKMLMHYMRGEMLILQ